MTIFLFSHSATAPTVTPTKGQISNSLLDGQDWSHFAGASQDSAGVHIQSLGRAIVNQDGSGGQPNPPVNIRGPHLALNGDFEITTEMNGLSQAGTASLYIYGAAPVIYDEWRYEPPQLRLNISPNIAAIDEWGGSSDNPVAHKQWPVAIGDKARVILAFTDKKIILELGGQKIGELPDNDIFSSRMAWFGADASIGRSGWTLKNLTAQGINGGTVKIVDGSVLKVPSSDPQALRTLSQANFRQLPVGAAVADYALFSDSAYWQLVASQFSMLVPENEMKPQFIHPQSDVYSFKEADSLVDFALANGMKVHGHTLEFSEANPRWMQKLPLNQRPKTLNDHIKTVVSHFGSKVSEWDVVDEPLNDNNDNNGDSSDLRQNIWLAAMGEQYIDAAFKTAHAANPKADLYINEYGLEADGSRWDEFLNLIKRLQARGVPIDGVGFQAHVHEPGDEINASVLERHMQILAGLGLKSRISEMDVYGDNAQLQADQYAVTLQACLDVSSCTSFTTWGVTDKYGSTTEIHEYPLNYGNDLVWDANFKPKAAYSSLQNTLRPER